MGQASVADIRKRLIGSPTASTVHTLLKVMAGRGFVADDGTGYAKLYHAKIDKQAGQDSALKRLIDTVFGGSTGLKQTICSRLDGIDTQAVIFMRQHCGYNHIGLIS